MVLVTLSLAIIGLAIAILGIYKTLDEIANKLKETGAKQ